MSSLTGVPVACAFSTATWSGRRPLADRQRRIARSTLSPEGSGAVSPAASFDEPLPSSSPSTGAPRLRADLADSRTRNAAPSPGTIPSRRLSNARGLPGLIVPSAEWPSRLAAVTMSAPPATQRSAMPAPINSAAMAMASDPAEQAVLTQTGRCGWPIRSALTATHVSMRLAGSSRQGP